MSICEFARKLKKILMSDVHLNDTRRAEFGEENVSILNNIQI